MSQMLPIWLDPIDNSPLEQKGDELVSTNSHRSYAIVNNIPRFVSLDNYASSFGKQWILFSKTQLDSHTGLSLSEERLSRCLNGSIDLLEGKKVLEAGSGAGRFTEILLRKGAKLDSFDYSTAVEANYTNNGLHPNLRLAQADVREMPFPSSHYDFVICLGVVQHTPSSEQTIRELWSRVKPGGALVFDHYRKKLRNYLPPPLGVGGMLYRLYFLSLPKDKQFDAVKRVFDFWFPIIWKCRANKLIQALLARITPIVNYYPHFGLKDKNMYYEWMLLDTHDAATDVFKHRRTCDEIKHVLAELGAVDIKVVNGGNGVEAFCRKPS